MLSAGIFEESPSEALETAYQAANEGDYGTANEYLAPQMAREMEGDTRRFWDSATQGGSITQTSAWPGVWRGPGATFRRPFPCSRPSSWRPN
jgi:hypothetical protein